jgi:ABC-2 type transport system ATP-binding protein
MCPPPPPGTLAAMKPQSMAIETQELSKRYRRVKALTACTVTVPEGRVCALVGPNGAGKTTLLRMLAGLTRPTGGTARVLDGVPRQDSAFLAEVGFLAQEIPLYRRFTTEDHIRIGAHMNPCWDASLVRTQLERLRIPLNQRVGTLSGGQRAQVALALTLAKRPRLLLLDEPVAALDPLARRNFLATLSAVVADAGLGLTVVLSSHLVSDLERVCNHLILLAASRVQLSGDIDTLLAEHKVLVGTDQSSRLVRLNGPVTDPACRAQNVTLEQLVVAYMGADDASAGKHLTTIGEGS